MDKNEVNTIEFESIKFIVLNNKYEQRKKNQCTISTNHNKKTIIFSNKKLNNKKSAHSSKFSNYVRYINILFINVKKFFLINTIILFFLSIYGILCESYIIVNIKKAGRYKILYNGGVEDTNHWRYEVPNHTPKRITINENEIDTSTREYDFTQQENTIKLYYEDTKDDFKCLFYGCSDIDEIDASNLITSNADQMQFMFYLCSSVTSLNINNFNTKKVKYMRSMFGFCSSLISINVSHFVTPLLADIAFMFEGCSNLTSIYLLNFDTKEVWAMDRLFKGCVSLTTLDITNFRISKVKWMGGMFGNCCLLTTLDLSNFDTSSVEYFDGMFDSCKSLTSLDLSNFNTGKAITMHAMLCSIDVTI